MTAHSTTSAKFGTRTGNDAGDLPFAGPIIRLALLNGRSSPPRVVRQLLEQTGWCLAEHTEVAEDDRPAGFRRFDVAVLADRETTRDKRTEEPASEQDRQLELLQQFGLGVLVITARPWGFAGCGAGVVCLPPDASVKTVHGALLAMSRMRPILRQIDRQVNNLNRLSETLGQQFDATNRELQLASRLQRDFLPRELPDSGPVRFATLFRPCTWVSGDIFDVFRLDETHWGFYIADAVGHGVAAGLLTMYIKHAIRPKLILGDRYELVPPAEVLAMLNDQLVSQELPDSQFITGIYGMIDVQTLELQYSVAGHPPPLFIPRDGELRELHGEGCILGLSAGQTFSTESLKLRAGDRLLLYSDGLEGLMISHRPPLPQMPALNPGIPEMLRQPREEVVGKLRDLLDSSPGSLANADDVTALVLDVTA